MSLITPYISPEANQLAPGFRALSITVQAAAVVDPNVGGARP
ncbi:hypothetical protein ACET7P_14615 [Aeromonas veronii]